MVCFWGLAQSHGPAKAFHCNSTAIAYPGRVFCRVALNQECYALFLGFQPIWSFEGRPQTVCVGLTASCGLNDSWMQ